MDRLGVIMEKDSITLQEIIEEVKKNDKFKYAGDVITFSGIARETSLKNDKRVNQIEIQAYKEMADKQLHQICTELIEQYDLIDARVVHYQGFFNVGENLVHCVIASKHRKNGFKALEEMIESYKKRAYIFKCEIYEDGTTEWITTENTERNG
ncbi:MAG: molybdenum cofactor biosynthesis protein MoaE [Candidatus Hodarchaeales archaeon]|jgi:molybdopterin synthase catalytic subunit